MANATDTTTTLNPGSGGDAMDESLVTQSDGATLAKRPRVDVGYQSSDGKTGRLVDESRGLPVRDETARTHLEQMAEEMRAIRMMLEAFLNE